MVDSRCVLWWYWCGVLHNSAKELIRVRQQGWRCTTPSGRDEHKMCRRLLLLHLNIPTTWTQTQNASLINLVHKAGEILWNFQGLNSVLCRGILPTPQQRRLVVSVNPSRHLSTIVELHYTCHCWRFPKKRQARLLRRESLGMNKETARHTRNATISRLSRLLRTQLVG